MTTIAKQDGFCVLADAQMLEEWKMRRGFYSGVRSCDAEREDGMDLDGVLQREYRNWYARLLREAPVEMLPVEDVAGECTASVDSRCVVTISLPGRCIRPLSVRLEGWQQAVSRFAEPDSAEADAQRSEWTQAGTERPVVVAGPHSLTAYSAPSADSVTVDCLLAVCEPVDGTFRFREDAWLQFPGYFELA